jgi:hypothetical protein
MFSGGGTMLHKLVGSVKCVQGLPAKCNLDYAFYRHGEELWCYRPEEPKWRPYKYCSVSDTHKLLLNWALPSLYHKCIASSNDIGPSGTVSIGTLFASKSIIQL